MSPGRCMISRSNYTFAIAVDMALLWGRSGGKYAIPALVAAGFLSVIDGVPGWTAWAASAVAGVFALTALWRMQPILAVRRNGIEIAGRITEVERKRSYVSSSESTKLRKRLTYEYEVEGTTYRGRTRWAGSGRFGTLEAGNPIRLMVDQTQPDRAAWVEDVPLRKPELIGF